MTGLAWIGMILLIGANAALTERKIREADERIQNRLQRMQDQLFGLCKRLGVDPVNPLDGD